MLWNTLCHLEGLLSAKQVYRKALTTREQMNLSWMEGTEKLPHLPSFCSSFRYCHYPLRIRFPVAAGSREAGVSGF